MNEQTLRGAALLGYRMTMHGTMTKAADAVEKMGTEELLTYAQIAGYENGTYVDTEHNRAVVRKALHAPPPRPEPTHGLDSPPDLTDGPLDPIDANGLAALFLGPGQTTGENHLCKLCYRPMAITPGLHYVCMNDECERYEEVR